jgi:hypothetical protein
MFRHLPEGMTKNRHHRLHFGLKGLAREVQLTGCMSIVKSVFAVMIVASQLVSLNARAATCELPHERLQARCGGDMTDYVSRLDESNDSLSAVQKTQKKNASQLVNEYRQKAQQNSEIVDKALEEHKLFLQQKH